MLSIASLTKGPGYYLELANINYYNVGGEPLPTWYGNAAREFGLSGIAEREHVERLCSGFHHETKKALVRNAGVTAGPKKRNPGHDLTFSAPKTVSLAWATADDALRRAISLMHEEAVKAALDFIEAKAGFARIGTDGLETVRTSLLFALFEHGTSRAMDPQLHTHALCINLTMHPDGHTTAMDSTHLYHWKMAAGAIYRVVMASRMQELGFAIEQRQIGASIGFELKIVPKGLVDESSKRRAEITQILKLRAGSLDTASPKYAELVAKETRRTKDTEKSRSELLHGWKEDGKRYGLTSEYLYASLDPFGGRISPEERAERRERIFCDAVAALSERHSHWNEADLTKAVAERAIGELPVNDVLALIEEKLLSPDLIRLGTLTTETKEQNPNRYIDRTEVRYTTPEMFQLERQMLRKVELIIGHGDTGSSPDLIEEVVSSRKKLRPEQKEAVEWLCSGPSIRLLSGIAGTGKTYTLQTCKEVWDREGKELFGCAIMAQTAKRLEKATGIPSRTLDSLLWNLDNGKITLDARSVIVFDEAAMTGSRHMARLISHLADAPGARLIKVGDGMQIQPILAGGPFEYLRKDLKGARLTEVFRQDEPWAREAVKKFEAGDIREALDDYKKHDRLHVAETRPEAIVQLVEQWRADGGVHKPENVLLLASLVCEVQEINLAAQAARISAGVVNGERNIPVNGVLFCEGDRIQFLRNSTELGVDNGNSATVTRVDPERNRFFVRVDDAERETLVSLKRYPEEKLRLGYASTTHKAQGATVPHAHVLVGGPLTDQHMGYVQTSRSIISTHLFTDQDTAGENLRDLVRELSRNNQKTLAHEIASPVQRYEPELSPSRNYSLNP